MSSAKIVHRPSQLPDDDKSCCPPESSMSVRVKSVAKGTVMAHGDQSKTRLYVAGDPSATYDKGIIMVPDVTGFGGDHARIRLMSDELAEHGYLVVVPDVFHGKDWTPDQGRPALRPILKQFPYTSIGHMDVLNSLGFLQNRGVESVGIVGYCWGTYTVMRASTDAKLPIKAGVSIQPAHTNVFKLHGEDEAKVLSSIRCAQLIISARNDPDTGKPGGIADQILNSSQSVDTASCDFEVHEDMDHGWVTRGDLSDPLLAQKERQAMETTIAFLGKHL